MLEESDRVFCLPHLKLFVTNKKQEIQERESQEAQEAQEAAHNKKQTKKKVSTRSKEHETRAR